MASSLAPQPGSRSRLPASPTSALRSGFYCSLCGMEVPTAVSAAHKKSCSRRPADGYPKAALLRYKEDASEIKRLQAQRARDIAAAAASCGDSSESDEDGSSSSSSSPDTAVSDADADKDAGSAPSDNAASPSVFVEEEATEAAAADAAQVAAGELTASRVRLVPAAASKRRRPPVPKLTARVNQRSSSRSPVTKRRIVAPLAVTAAPAPVDGIITDTVRTTQAFLASLAARPSASTLVTKVRSCKEALEARVLAPESCSASVVVILRASGSIMYPPLGRYVGEVLRCRAGHVHRGRYDSQCQPGPW